MARSHLANIGVEISVLVNGGILDLAALVRSIDLCSGPVSLETQIVFASHVSVAR
jgi:hypothetical protein